MVKVSRGVQNSKNIGVAMKIRKKPYTFQIPAELFEKLNRVSVEKDYNSVSLLVEVILDWGLKHVPERSFVLYPDAPRYEMGYRGTTLTLTPGLMEEVRRRVELEREEILDQAYKALLPMDKSRKVFTKPLLATLLDLAHDQIRAMTDETMNGPLTRTRKDKETGRKFKEIVLDENGQPIYAYLHLAPWKTLRHDPAILGAVFNWSERFRRCNQNKALEVFATAMFENGVELPHPQTKQLVAKDELTTQRVGFLVRSADLPRLQALGMKSGVEERGAAAEGAKQILLAYNLNPWPLLDPNRFGLSRLNPESLKEAEIMRTGVFERPLLQIMKKVAKENGWSLAATLRTVVRSYYVTGPGAENR